MRSEWASPPYPNFVSDFGGSATVAQSLVPYPQYSYIFNNFEGFGTTQYESAQIQVEKRFTNGLSFLAGYTLSRLMGQHQQRILELHVGRNQQVQPEAGMGDFRLGRAANPEGQRNLRTAHRPGQEIRQQPPAGQPGRRLAGRLDIWTTRPEPPYGPGENGSPFPNGFERPDRNTSVGLSTASYSRVRDYFVGKIPVAQMFNPAAFTPTPTQYVIGTAQRNYAGMRNAPLYLENINAKKNFYIGERWKAILSVDYFNAFNRTQFNGPDNNVSDGTFGQVTSQGSNISNRQGQVTFRVEF